MPRAAQLVWKYSIENQIRCTPTVVEGRAFVAGCDGALHIIDLAKGTELASVDIEAPTGVTPAAVGDQVFFGTEGSQFFCVDWKKADGRLDVRGRQAATTDAQLAGRVGRNEWSSAGEPRRSTASTPRTGSWLWEFATRQRVDSSPVIVGERVFVAAGDGRLYALDLATGKEIWQLETGGGFTGSPAVAAERLVIASDDGVVYCFGRSGVGPCRHETDSCEAGMTLARLPGPVASETYGPHTRDTNHACLSETTKTEVGNYFISNYPPFSCWTERVGRRKCARR